MDCLMALAVYCLMALAPMHFTTTTALETFTMKKTWLRSAKFINLLESFRLMFNNVNIPSKITLSNRKKQHHLNCLLLSNLQLYNEGFPICIEEEEN